MMRWIIGLSAVGIVLIAVAAWATSKPVEVYRPAQGELIVDNRNQGENGERPRPKEIPGNPVVLGPMKAFPNDLPRVDVTDQLVLPDLRTTLLYSQDVPSPRSGTLRLLATEVKEGEPEPSPDRLLVRRVPIMIRLVKQGEIPTKKYQYPGDTRVWKAWTDGETLEPDQVAVWPEERKFRRLREGDIVKADDFLGVIDPELAVAELSIKIANLSASEAKRKATIKTQEEAEARLKANLEANDRVPGSIPAEEVRASRLTVERYKAEVVAETQNRIKAEAELRQSYLVLKQHVLRVDPSVRVGRIKTIYKKEGEAIKEQETVLAIQNQDDLQVEGLVELQQARRLRPGQKVYVEAPVQKAPLREISGPRDEVLAVAVSKGITPWVVASSADRSVRAIQLKQDSTAIPPRGETGPAWVIDREKKVWTLDHPAVVRAMQCSPRTVKENLLLTGAADGSARIWNLDKLDESARDLKTRHKSGINAVAFSPDGQWCVTGGEDTSLCLVEVGSGELKDHRIDAHKGAVTSVTFTADNKLVTAGRDSFVVVWNLANGKLNREREMPGRVGSVDQLGVSPDGKNVIFDQGKELRVLSLADTTAQGVIQNSTGAVNFTTLALFSPDGNTVVTVGASDNRLQLWRNPTKGRPSELRQYMWSSGQTTCAAFAPDANLLVTGSQDKYVLIWGLPTAEELKESTVPNAYISLIDESLDSGSRQVKIRAIVERKPEGLIPGSTATMVVPPTK